MAYEKQTWTNGEVITDTKLNHMEEGIASAGGNMIIKESLETYALDKTWQEISDYIDNGGVPFVLIKFTDTAKSLEFVSAVSHNEVDGYIIQTTNTDYATPNPNGYPVAHGDK